MNNDTIKKALVKELVDAFEKRLTTTIVSRGVVEGQVERIIEIYEPHFKQTNEAVEFAEWLQKEYYVKYLGADSSKHNTWYKYTSDDRIYFSSKELYQLFIIEKNGHKAKRG